MVSLQRVMVASSSLIFSSSSSLVNRRQELPSSIHSLHLLREKHQLRLCSGNGASASGGGRLDPLLKGGGL